MPTELRLSQIKGIPDLTTADVNKALVFKGNDTFAFESAGTGTGGGDVSGLEASISALDGRVDALEASSITSVDGGEY